MHDHPREQGIEASLSSLLTVADIASNLGVSTDVVRDLLRNGKLQGAKIGGQWRVQPADLADYVMKTFERPP